MRLRQGRARRAAGTQVVVITDSTQGLGFGYAQGFLHRGHHVVISGHTQSLVDEAIDRLEADAVVGGGAAIGQACDVTDRAQLQSLWGFTVRSFGPVGIWLHNTDPARPGTAIGALNSAEVAVAGLSAQLHGGKLYLNLGCDGAIGRIAPGMTVGSDTQDELKRVADSLLVARHKTGDSRVLIGTISPGVSVTGGCCASCARCRRRCGAKRCGASALSAIMLPRPPRGSSSASSPTTVRVMTSLGSPPRACCVAASVGCSVPSAIFLRATSSTNGADPPERSDTRRHGRCVGIGRWFHHRGRHALGVAERRAEGGRGSHRVHGSLMARNGHS